MIAAPLITTDLVEEKIGPLFHTDDVDIYAELFRGGMASALENGVLCLSACLCLLVIRFCYIILN